MSDILSGNWDELVDDVKKQWNKFSDEELKNIGGYKDKLLDALQEKYGYAKNKAEEEIEKFMEKHDINWMDIKEKTTRFVKDFPKEVGECIEENPFKSVLIALGAGLILGSLVMR